MKQKLGSESRTGDHGKWVCGVQTLLQRPGCVVYSIGSGGLTGERANNLLICSLSFAGTDSVSFSGAQPSIRWSRVWLKQDVG